MEESDTAVAVDAVAVDAVAVDAMAVDAGVAVARPGRTGEMARDAAAAAATARPDDAVFRGGVTARVEPEEPPEVIEGFLVGDLPRATSL